MGLGASTPGATATHIKVGWGACSTWRAAEGAPKPVCLARNAGRRAPAPLLRARHATLLSAAHRLPASSAQGIGSGGGGNRVAAHRCTLAEVRLGSRSFPAAQALYHQIESGGGNGGLELSQHTSGIVCGGVLGRCSLTYDYANARVAVSAAPPPERAHSCG